MGCRHKSGIVCFKLTWIECGGVVCVGGGTGRELETGCVWNLYILCLMALLFGIIYKSLSSASSSLTWNFVVSLLSLPFIHSEHKAQLNWLSFAIPIRWYNDGVGLCAYVCSYSTVEWRSTTEEQRIIAFIVIIDRPPSIYSVGLRGKVAFLLFCGP